MKKFVTNKGLLYRYGNSLHGALKVLYPDIWKADNKEVRGNQERKLFQFVQ